MITRLKLIFAYAIIGITLLSIDGCRVKNFFSIQPDYESNIQPRTLQSSLIQIPIDVPMAVFSNEMNKILNGLIYKDTLYENNDNDNLKVKVWRTKKEIKVDGHQQKIRFQLPLEIWAQYQWKACDVCPSIEKSTSFDLHLTLVTQIQLGKDWSLVTTTTATDMQFSKEPVLDFGMIKIPITRFIKTILNTNMPAITSSIDREVANTLPLRTYIEEAWLQVQDPILLDSTYQAWLLMKPISVQITPLNCDLQKLSLRAGMDTFIETHIGNKPTVPLKTFLTSPVIKEKLSNQFMIELPIKIGFDMISQIAKSNLKDSAFQISKNKKITIIDIRVYGRAGYVFAQTELKGSFDGMVYFKGKPALDTITNNIYLQDFDYDINTKNGLYSFASWMLHSTLRKMMEKQFQYNILKDIEGAQLAINQLLNGYIYNNYFQINGVVSQLKLSDISCLDDGIQTVFRTSGESRITFLNFTR
ncbi:MAG: DUF4403 family protein [Flavobacteriales bacterium]|nr:DUF4403 family protein [Flavobacteriales bacterium]